MLLALSGADLYQRAVFLAGEYGNSPDCLFRQYKKNAPGTNSVAMVNEVRAILVSYLSMECVIPIHKVKWLRDASS